MSRYALTASTPSMVRHCGFLASRIIVLSIIFTVPWSFFLQSFVFVVLVRYLVTDQSKLTPCDGCVAVTDWVHKWRSNGWRTLVRCLFALGNSALLGLYICRATLFLLFALEPCVLCFFLLPLNIAAFAVLRVFRPVTTYRIASLYRNWTY